jgi:hypothetical protein
LRSCDAGRVVAAYYWQARGGASGNCSPPRPFS